MTRSPHFPTHLKNCFADYTPDTFTLDRPKAAVLVPIVLDPEPSVLLTVRASHLNSHPGQVSFPGGMEEVRDKTLFDTALRETREEILIDENRVELVGGLSTTISKDGVLVYPVVGMLENTLGAEASPDEIAEIFHVPWRFFAEEQPELQRMDRHGISFQIPHYHFEGKHIWGLTAMILLELINLVEGTSWPTPQFSLATRPGETP
jgi:8-oxo-dGTP pyrophosphatase MutT (NUDIX family)